MTVEGPGDLAATLATYDQAYLVTIGPDTAPHVVPVTAVLRGDTLEIDAPGATTRRNVGRTPAVTLLCPPRTPAGHTLIIDGTADTTPTAISITPTKAILHRDPPPPTPTQSPCPHDCHHLPLP